jgi:hypothetical protein
MTGQFVPLVRKFGSDFKNVIQKLCEISAQIGLKYNSLNADCKLLIYSEFFLKLNKETFFSNLSYFLCNFFKCLCTDFCAK